MQENVSSGQGSAASNQGSMSGSYVPSASSGSSVSSSDSGSSAPTVTCVSLIKSLTFGASDAGSSGAVTAMQEFLFQTGYLAVSPNGHFGPATLRAVKNFQLEEGLSTSGFVGPLTRQKIQEVSCGSSIISPTAPSAPVSSAPVAPPVAPALPAHPIIASLWPAVGPAGTQVVIRGSNFTPGGNAIAFGNSYDPALLNVSSYDGASLFFTVPSDVQNSGSYPVTVSNANGKSNTQIFNVPVPWYDSGPSTPGFPTFNPGTGAPTLSYFAQNSAPSLTTVTLYGTGFAATGNTVNFGPNATITDVASSDGTTLRFTVPSHNNPPNCPYNAACQPPPIPIGVLQVSVTNSGGTSNSLPFTITSSGGYSPTPGVAPVISSLSVNWGPVGTSVTITGSGFDSQNYVLMNGNMTGSSLNAGDGNTLTFTIPTTLSAKCNLFGTTGACAMFAQLVTPNMYEVSVINQSGTSNALLFTVTSASCTSGTSGCNPNNCPNGTSVCNPNNSVNPGMGIVPPTISSLNPTNGTSGTLVTLSGIGFTQYGNQVLFDGAKVPDIYISVGNDPSTFNFKVQGSPGQYYDFTSNGSTITFAAPLARHDNCNDALTACTSVIYPPYAMGPHTVQVTNANGTSNTVTFSLHGLAQ